MAKTPEEPLKTWKGSNGGGQGWGWDEESKERTMPPLQEEFLDWLLSDPRDPATQTAWAVEHGVHEDTPKRWKRNARFIAVWDERARQKNISVDRVQRVVDSLHASAINGDVKAAQLYLQYIDRFTPKVRVVNETADTAQLSDEELLAELDRVRDDLASM